MRAEQIVLLERELEKATKRIQYYRATYPAINENDCGYYLDGSAREQLEDFGGFSRPSYRAWSLGYTSNREMYIYEEISWDLWGFRRDDEIGIDTYGLALSDPTHVTYHNQGCWIGKVNTAKILDDANFTIDMIVWMTEELGQFLATDEVFRASIEEFTSKIVHRAHSQLIFT